MATNFPLLGSFLKQLEGFKIRLPYLSIEVIYCYSTTFITKRVLSVSFKPPNVQLFVDPKHLFCCGSVGSRAESSV